MTSVDNSLNARALALLNKDRAKLGDLPVTSWDEATANGHHPGCEAMYKISADDPHDDAYYARLFGIEVNEESPDRGLRGRLSDWWTYGDAIIWLGAGIPAAALALCIALLIMF